MSIAQARKLLDLSSSSSLENLLDCLILLSKDYGHVRAMQEIGFRDPVSATENLLEIQIYLDKIKNRIIYCRNTYMHKLIFNMNLDVSLDLIYGNLQLAYPNGEKIDYIATSGVAGWQQPQDVWARGRGPIPAGEYQISNEPYWLETRGIEGLFYHITPDPVGSGDHVRGELGLHFDANVPGSSGCIVLRNESGWKRLCDRLATIANQGVRSLPLTVKYA